MAERTTPRATRRNRPLRLFLVGPESLVGMGIRRALEQQSGFEVVADAPSTEGALPLLGAAHPDVIVIDLRLLETDPTQTTRRLREAAEDAAVVVVTAFDPPGPLRIKRGAPGLDEYRRELEEEAKETAAEVTAQLVNWGVDARAVVAPGHPADVILQAAGDEGADLIMLGASRGGAGRYLMGSTAERVVRLSVATLSRTIRRLGITLKTSPARQRAGRG